MQTSKLFNTLVAAIVLSGASSTASHAADSAPKAQAPAKTVVAANAAAAVPDETITSSAKAALSADAQAATLPVKVATQQGVVVLSGDVPSAEAGDRVVQIVASVSGVKEIKNELKVLVSSADKKKAAVAYLDAWIKLPVYMEWVDDMVLGWMVDSAVAALNKKYGQEWGLTSKEAVAKVAKAEGVGK